MNQYNPNKVELHKEESGCILSWWASVPGHPTRCVGRVDDTTKEEAAQRAIKIAYNSDLWAELETNLHLEFPNKQIYKGSPSMCRDINWAGLPDKEYLYVLKDRRKHGKYQILRAYTI